MDLYIPILLGTAREGRESIKAARALKAHADTLPGLETEIVDPKDFTFPQDGYTFQDERYESITARADGFFIVTPEYNHGYPPSLKRMLDSEDDFSHYGLKPVSLAGVSDGNWGGVRAIEALVNVLRTMDMYITRRDVKFARITEIFDEDGNLTDERVKSEIEKTWDDLMHKARILKPARTK